jgi:hypothetical protein
MLQPAQVSQPFVSGCCCIGQGTLLLSAPLQPCCTQPCRLLGEQLGEGCICEGVGQEVVLLSGALPARQPGQVGGLQQALR